MTQGEGKKRRKGEKNLLSLPAAGHRGEQAEGKEADWSDTCKIEKRKEKKEEGKCPLFL